MSDDKKLTEQHLDEAAHVRYLKPDDFILFRHESGTLTMTLKDDRSFLRITARRAFPFSYPTKYISIKSGNDEEIGIIPDLTELSKEYRHWIEHELEMRYFTPIISAINTIRRRRGGIEWLVETNGGPKRIIAKTVQDAVAEIEQGRFLITDVDGNRYEICPEDLDEASRTKFDTLV